MIELRALHGEPAEMGELQRVIEAAPAYAQMLTGVPPGPADAQSTFTILPEGRSYDDKFVLGIYEAETIVGCVDLIRGWPDAATAHIGLLLIEEARQRQGIGSAAVREIERLVRSWPAPHACSRLRLGVLQENEGAQRFWRRLGFAPTGEVKPYRYGPVVSEIRIYRKALDATGTVSGGSK